MAGTGDVTRLIKDAMEHDTAGRSSVAFSKYMECVGLLARKIEDSKSEATPNLFSVKNSQRLFKLLHHCVERAEQLVADNSGTSPVPSPDIGGGASNSATASPLFNNSRTSSASSTIGQPTPAVQSPVPQAAQPQPEADELERMSRQPIIEAQRRNKELLRSYQRKLTSLSGTARANMQTSLMRTMVENIQIAENQRQQMLKRAADIQRLQDEGESRLRARSTSSQTSRSSSTSGVSLATVVDGLVALVENISGQMDILDQRPKRVRELDESIRKVSSADSDQIYILALSAFQLEEHPFGQHLQEFTTTFHEYYSEKTLQLNTASKDDIMAMQQKVVKEIQAYIFYAHKAFLKTYPQLGADDAVRQTTLAIEDALFTQVYATVFEVFRMCYREADKTLTDHIGLMSELLPEEVGVKSKFWLMPQADEELEPEFTPPPYQKAIDIFNKITNAATPAEKASCIVKTSQAICQCVTDFWTQRGMDAAAMANFAIGADDLIPIFCYVIVKTNPPCLLSQSEYLTEFINEHMANGEEGYAVATLDTVLQMLTRMAAEKTISFT